MLKKELLYFRLFNCALGLLLGVLIYILFSENTYINKLISLSFSITTPFTDLLRFYIADALWAYALTFALSIFINESLSGIVAVIYGVLWEILQSFNASLGTYDSIDLLMYLSASTIAVLIIKLYKRRKK